MEEIEDLLDRVEEALGRGDAARAKEALSKASALAPTDPDVLLFKATVAELEGDDDAAWDALEAALDAHGDDPIVLASAAGHILDLDEQPDQALDLAEEAAAILEEKGDDDGFLPEVLALVARCKLGMGDADGAVEAAEKAVELDAECAAARVALGRGCFALWRLDSARDAFVQALARDAESAEAAWYLGWTARLLGDDRAASSAFERAVAAAPDALAAPLTLDPNAIQAAWAEALALIPAAAQRVTSFDVADLPRAPSLPDEILEIDDAGRVRVFRRNLEIVAAGADLAEVLRGALLESLAG